MTHTCVQSVQRITVLGVTFLLCTECGAEWDYQDAPPTEDKAEPLAPPEPDTSV